MGAVSTRRKIKKLLSENKAMYYGDIVKELDGDPHTILQALIDLKNMGDVRKGQPNGKFYLVN